MDPLEFMQKKVVEAGEKLLAAREGVIEVSSKGENPRDVVTNTDLEINEFLVGEIKKNFPDHSIYSEEGSNKAVESEYLWTIDPIDGSSNFSRGIPHFAVCLGLLKDNEAVAGAVYNPVTQELFSFKKGSGAYLNGKRIGVSPVAELAKAQVIFSPGSRKPELWDWAARSYRKLLEASLKRGMFGSSSLDVCFIAAGRADAGVYGTLSTFDIAGALGLLEEAGGVYANEAGEKVVLSSVSQKVYLANSSAMLGQIRGLLEG
jgi:myo-inositol-1(or 4)-monophosphatase